MFTSPEEFFDNGLRPLIEGHAKLNVLFATYRTINSYDDGLVATGKPGLEILVQTGHLRSYSILSEGALFSPDPIINMVGVAMMASQSADAQFLVESGLREKSQSHGAPDIAVIYAGLTAFERALGMAKNIKRDYPKITVIMTTCDCDPSMKMRELAPLLESGAIKAVVETPYCGGEGLMRDLINEIIKIFPEQPAPVSA